MHFKQDSVARKTNCFQDASIFVFKALYVGGGRWERGAPRPWLSIGPRTLLIRLSKEDMIVINEANITGVHYTE